MYDKTAMNAWASARYDELMREGKHGHYESMFRVIHEAIARAPAPAEGMAVDMLLEAADSLAKSSRCELDHALIAKIRELLREAHDELGANTSTFEKRRAVYRRIDDFLAAAAPSPSAFLAALDSRKEREGG